MTIKLFSSRPWYGESQKKERSQLSQLGFTFDKHGMVAGPVELNVGSLDMLFTLAQPFGRLMIEFKNNEIHATLGA